VPTMSEPLCRRIHAWAIPWRELPWPPDWRGVFGHDRERELAVEIGYGNGDFLIEEAGRRGDRNHVGIEVSWTSTTHLLARIDKHGLGNVRALLGDARVALGVLFEPESIDRVFLNHPHPWPKARHHGRRIVEPGFLRLLAERMKPSAKLTIVTDHAAYAEWIAEVLEAQDDFVSCHPGTETDAIPGRTPTKYERRALAQGIRIHYFEWRRERAPERASPQPACAGLDTMPNVTLRGRFDAERLLGDPPGTLRGTHEGVDVTVRLGPVWRGEAPGSWLVEALVKEDHLRQDFALVVLAERGRGPAEGGSGELLVKLSGLGSPHPTWGVRRAVRMLGDWLRRRHPDLEVAHDNLGRDVTDD